MENIEKVSKSFLFSNDSGLNISEIKHGIDDAVVFQDFCGDRLGRKRTAKIRYNAKGEPYFISYGSRYYIKDFV